MQFPRGRIVNWVCIMNTVLIMGPQFSVGAGSNQDGAPQSYNVLEIPMSSNSRWRALTFTMRMKMHSVPQTLACHVIFRRGTTHESSIYNILSLALGDFGWISTSKIHAMRQPPI